jgi:hypothetical protein
VDVPRILVIKQASPVVIVVDEILASISARHYVIDGIFIFDAKSSGHEGSIGRCGEDERETKNQV